MHEGKAWLFHSSNPQLDGLGYLVGFLFALSLEFGIYFAAINGRRETSNWFAFISAILAVISFQGLILNSLQNGKYQPITFETSIMSVEWWFIFIGILIIAVYPAVFIADVSHKLFDIYQKEGWKFEQPYVKKPAYKRDRSVEVEEVDDLTERFNRLKKVA
jgi:hypothetical protein